MPIQCPDLSYADARALVLSGEISSIHVLLRALPLARLARDLDLDEREVVELQANIFALSIYHYYRLADLLELSHKQLVDIVSKDGDALWIAMTREKQETGVQLLVFQLVATGRSLEGIQQYINDNR